MRFKVLDRLKVSTPQGERELDPGQIISLPKEKAIRLLNEGRIDPVGKFALKLYSSILEAHIWVVNDSLDWQNLLATGDAVYDIQEIIELKISNLNPEELRAVNNTKKAFQGTRVLREGE
jgi:hypothetical protein